MPHIPGHFQTRDRSNNISNSPNYRIYGTNQPYSGMTVEIGGHLYTTKGGALEGNSYQLVAAQQMTPDGFANPDLGNLDPLVRRPMTPEGDFIVPRPRPNDFGSIGDFGTLPNEIIPIRPRPNPNPQDVITRFKVGDNSEFGGRRSYYYIDGTRVPKATQLHHHTIPPRGRGNFMTQHEMDGREQDVFTSRPRLRQGQEGGGTRLGSVPSGAGAVGAGAAGGMRGNTLGGNVGNQGNQGGGGY